MSTPAWPVPYHNRITRAEPHKASEVCISNNGRQICSLDVDMTKHLMNQTTEGRASLEHFQNHAVTDSYIITQNDSGNMIKAYAADLVKHIDVAIGRVI